MMMPPVQDSGTEVTLVTHEGRFVPGMFWPKKDLPNVEGVAGEMRVTGHGYVAYSLRTESGRLLIFVLYARLVPGLQFELTSEHDLVKAGLRIEKDEDGDGAVASSLIHKQSGEVAKLSAYRKLFCLNNVPIDYAALNMAYRQARVVDDIDRTVALVAKTKLDLQELETKMGFLHANDSQKLCSKWGVTLSRAGKEFSHINQIAKGSSVPRNKDRRSERDVKVGEHIICDPMGDSHDKTMAGNRALHGVTDWKRRLYFYSAHPRMNGFAATSSVEEFIRWANLPFSTSGKVLNNGSTIHTDGAKYYGTEFTGNFQYHGFKIYKASKYMKLTNRMYVIERMHRTVQARARAFLKIAEPVLKAEGYTREAFYDLCVCHSGDVCNYSPSNHFGGGCPIADVLGHEPTREETDAAIPGPWGCYCFPKTSPGIDQKQLADRREPALYMRTLPDGRYLCWRLRRRPGQEKWITTKDVVFSWGGLNLGRNKDRGYRPLSEDEMDVVDWAQAWEKRAAQGDAVPEAGVSWDEADDYDCEDDLQMIAGSLDTVSAVEAEIVREEAQGDAPLDYSFAENDGSVLPEVPLSPMSQPPIEEESLITVDMPQIGGDAMEEGDVIDLGGVMFEEIAEDGRPVLKMAALSLAAAIMNSVVSAPWDYPELGETELGECIMLDGEQLHSTSAMAGVEAGEAVPMLTYQDLKIYKQDAKPLPRNLKEAIKLPGMAGALWRKALKSEQDSYKENGVYTLVQRKHVPRGTKLYRFLNVIDRKYDVDTGLIAKLKVRLALMGQDQDTPFEHRHAAVPRASSIRMLEMIATEGDLHRWDSDTVTAFLQGEFQHGEEGNIYAIPPFHMTQLDPDGVPYLWALQKAVYGTRQAASAYVDTMEGWLFEEAPIPLKAMQEDCKVYRFDPQKLFTEKRFEKLRDRCNKQWPGWETRWLDEQYRDTVPPPAVSRAAGQEAVEARPLDYFDRPIYSMCAHIDDMRHYSTCKWLHEELFAPAFKARFKSTHSDGTIGKPDSGPSNYLNQRWRFGVGTASVDNEFWIRKFLEEQGMTGCKPQDCPMPEGLKLSKGEMPTTPEQEQQILRKLLEERKVGPGSVWPAVTTYELLRTKYRSVTAGMGWASQTTHPELQGPVSMWASQMAAPSYAAFVALPRGLRYLQRTKADAIVYTRSGRRNIVLKAQSDASLGADTGSGQSQYGFWISANDSAVIESRAARTKMVCLSTTHTEIVSLSECCRSLVALRRFLIEMGFPQPEPSVVECDNEMAIRLSKVKTNSEKSRTIRLRDFYSRECVTTGQVEVRFLAGADIDADIFTKAKGNPAFARMTQRLKRGSAV